MCEFCVQHGEGKKWYLNVNNYSVELLNDLKRKDFINNFYAEIIKKGNKSITRFEKMFQKNPKILEKMASAYTREMKNEHFGQVVPVEDVFEIFSLANSIVRLACGCRWEVEKKEGRFCFGVSFGPPNWYDEVDLDYFGTPDVSRLEALKKEEAVHCIKDLDDKGMVHSVWTFQTPFIGAICNCDITYCLALRTTYGLKMPTMFKSEQIAVIDSEKCNGCSACIENCQFEAIEYLETDRKAKIDYTKCYGCGVCRSVCKEQAIALSDRRSHSVSSSIW